ncbi:hypothetical protein HDV00_002010 [Rhizophlyctis rosea]|nr:hypothetical protein HDV00_002010 [Rhizophlyctis rosea]
MPPRKTIKTLGFEPVQQIQGQPVNLARFDNSTSSGFSYNVPTDYRIQWIRINGVPSYLNTKKLLLRFLPTRLQEYVHNSRIVGHHHPSYNDVEYLLGDIHIASQLIAVGHINTSSGRLDVFGGQIVQPPPNIHGPSDAQLEPRLGEFQ